MKLVSTKRFFAYALFTMSLAQVAGLARAADDFPSKPIRIIVPAAVGGGLDAASRLIGQKMSEKLGVQVIIDNQAGAETMLGTRVAKQAPGDGYTILGQAPGFTLLPYVKLDPGFDPSRTSRAWACCLPRRWSWKLRRPRPIRPCRTSSRAQKPRACLTARVGRRLRNRLRQHSSCRQQA